MTSQLKPSVSFKVHLELTEEEARVLELLSQFANYDVTQLLRTLSKDFKDEEVFRLIENIRLHLRPQVRVIDTARRAMTRALTTNGDGI